MGESGIGKTAICHQITSDGTDFPKNYIVTQLSEISVKTIKIPDTNDIVELYLIDCSGKELYQEWLKESWSQANLVIAVYDVTREESFNKVSKVKLISNLKLIFRIQVHNFTPYLQWVELVSHSAKKEQGENNNAKLTGVLLANKTDLEDRRIISPKLGTDLAGQLGLMYFECSAKDNKDVENPIYFLASEWHKVYTESSERLSSN